MNKPMAIVAAAALFALTACAGSTASQSTGTDDDSDDTSVKVETCGHQETFDKPPARVVVNTRGLVEVLAALGVADRIAAYSTLGHSHYEPLDKYKQTIADVPQESDGLFSKEAVVAEDPDFFYSDMNYGDKMVDDYDPLGIPVLFATRWCPQHAPTNNGTPDLIQGQFHDIADLGKIFNVEDKATELIDSLKKDLKAARKIANGNDSIDVASVAFYDGIGDRMTVNRSGMIDQLIDAVGGNNVYSTKAGADGDTSQDASLESLIDRDPDVIIVRETGQGDYKTVRNFFRHDERFSDIAAVKHDRFTYVRHAEALAGIQFTNAATRLAEAFDEYSQ